MALTAVHSAVEGCAETWARTPGVSEGETSLACSPWGCKKLGVTERLNSSKGVLHAPEGRRHHLHFVGEKLGFRGVLHAPEGRHHHLHFVGEKLGFREGEQFALGHTAIWGWQQEEGGLPFFFECLTLTPLAVSRPVHRGVDSGSEVGSDVPVAMQLGSGRAGI